MNYATKRPTVVCDTECYQNFWLIAFKHVITGKTKTFSAYKGKELDIEAIERIMRDFRIVTFNGNNYDIPMISLALSGATTGDLKRASDNIILAELRSWQFYDMYGVPAIRNLDHIDLIEVAPGKASLKIYGGRLHSKRIQDLPIDPDARISEEQRELLTRYCINDLDTTIDLWNELAPQIALREQMSNTYGLDLRSKSDAQISETVIKSGIEKITGKRIYAPDIIATTFYYKCPDFIKFDHPDLCEMLNRVKRAPFVVKKNGRIAIPQELEDFSMRIGNGDYRMGIGGLHSSESHSTCYSDDKYDLVEVDAASYYPAMIIRNGFIPRSLGQNFLRIYKEIYLKRLAAKAAGDKAVAESLKIAINGGFGKLGSPYSILYSPDLMIQVTMTGQLSLLMLIEQLEKHGIKVVSANTDGIMAKVPKCLKFECEMVYFDWELKTGMILEMKRYRSIHSKDVNNYIAIDSKDGVKLKGEYAKSGRGLPSADGLKKNPSTDVCVDAVIEYLKNGTPIDKTIERCADIRKFVTIRTVKGGAVSTDDTYLGKAVRWYYAIDAKGALRYKMSGNKVPSSDGAKPCMELPDDLPDDIDYEWYSQEAYAILKDVGVKFINPIYAGRSGEGYARLPNQKTHHIVDLSNGIALCGKEPSSSRIRWVEVDRTEVDRVCTKCRRLEL